MSVKIKALRNITSISAGFIPKGEVATVSDDTAEFCLSRGWATKEEGTEHIKKNESNADNNSRSNGAGDTRGTEGSPRVSRRAKR